MNIVEEKYNWRGQLQKRCRTDYIVIHNADAPMCSAQDVHRWHLGNGWAGIGYHFFVRKNGQIYRGRPLETVGAHTQGFNSVSVGICFEGKYHSVDKHMPDAQFTAGRELLMYLRQIYQQAAIKGHRDLMATDCPGRYFPYKKLVNGEEENLMSKEYDELSGRLAKVENPMIYNYMDENMPEWAKPTVQKLLDKGALKGNERGELGLTEEFLRVLVINDRMGVYDNEK